MTTPTTTQSPARRRFTAGLAASFAPSLGIVLGFGCDGDASKGAPPPVEVFPGVSAPAADAPPGPWFSDATDAANLHFRHENGASGRKYLVETNGSGAAWLDFDHDGDLDLYLVQGAALPGTPAPTGIAEPLHAVLLRNDAGRFTDVTREARVGNTRHGMAAAAPDYDNDGDADLYVTNFGPDVLYRNNGDGTFSDVTAQAGIADGERYHSSCAFADFDRDGDLDLYVVAYVDFRIGDGKVCGDTKRGPEYLSYCHPDNYKAQDDALYRNNGDGTFTDVSQQAGLIGKGGKGLGVAVADFDQDGDLDLFVANDSDENFLWRNDGELRFTDVASLWGVDYNGEGRTQACMGTAFGDVDGDGDLDLFTDTLSNEYNVLWELDGESYRDRSYASGLAAPSLSCVGFGTAMVDFDNDGDLDIVVANGHVLDNAELLLTGTTYRQPAQLYVNDGRGHFQLATAEQAGPYFGEGHVGRGLAVADLDDDGDSDLLFTNNHEAAHLLRNEVGSRNHWIGVELEGTVSNRDGIGAEVLVSAQGRIQRRLVRSAESYLSFHDLRVLIGLGSYAGPVDLSIHWPRGTVQQLLALPTGRYHHVTEPPP